MVFVLHCLDVVWSEEIKAPLSTPNITLTTVEIDKIEAFDFYSFEHKLLAPCLIRMSNKAQNLFTSMDYKRSDQEEACYSFGMSGIITQLASCIVLYRGLLLLTARVINSLHNVVTPSC
jgi:hypothetical protein